MKVINSVLKPNSKKKTETSLEINGESTSDPKAVANKFNAYFSSEAANLDEKIPTANVDPLSFISRQRNSFTFYKTNPSEINQLIKGFKSNKSSLNSIPIFAHKHIADIISPTIASLINESVKEGIFPQCLKTARVIPIYKSGEKKNS